MRGVQSKGKIPGPAENVVPVDICAEGSEAKMEAALKGADALVIATSAVPKIIPLSLLTVRIYGIVKPGPSGKYGSNQQAGSFRCGFS